MTSFSLGRALLVGSAFGLLAVTPASAQTRSATPPTSDQRALAEMLFFTGKGMMGDGRIAEACPKFAESYRLDPAAGTLLNLAVCHEKEGKIASAWGEFRQALAEARTANRQDRIDLVNEAIGRLQPDLPYVSIVVPKSVRVPGLEVRRNGVPLLEGAWDTELPIDPGENEITASAPRFQTETLTIKLDKLQHATVTLHPLEVDLAAIPPPPYWTTKRKVGTGLLAGGVAVAVVGAVFGGLAISEKNTSNGECPTFDNQVRCFPSGASAASTAQADAWVSNVGIGVGAAAIVVGGLLFGFGAAPAEGPPRAITATDTLGGWRLSVDPGLHGGETFLSRSF